MSRYVRVLFVTWMILMGAWPVMAQSQDSGGMLVGRVSHVEGQLLRFVPETKDWVATIKDAPFGMNDALYSDQQGKAEFIMPNNTWLRIGGSTQAQLITLKPDVTEVDIASGSARFYNRSTDGVIKATTPFGYVLAQAGGSFDLYVGDQSLEVISLRGDVSYVHGADQLKYDVVAGSSSIIADKQNVTSGAGNIDADWDDWNADRDRLWAKRLDVKGDSTRYLPEPLQDDAYSLEENGKWERVYYEGEYREYWRPTTVSSSWAPFTAGRWTDYYEDQAWVPDEPFGYVTHHYGNWVNVDGRWFWAPPPPPPPPVPVVGVAVGPVGVSIGFGWNPGRVHWIHNGGQVGWVPLAPTETYYGHHHWGHGSVVVGTAPIVNINIGNFAYLNHAVVVPQDRFYGVNNYSSVRVTNINKTTIINNYNAAPVVNNTVINNYNNNTNKYNYTNVAVDKKPHQSAFDRIQQNQVVAKNAANVNSKMIVQQTTAAKPATPVTTAKVAPPQVTSKIVPKADVAKPVNQVKFEQKPVLTKPKPVQDSAVVKSPILPPVAGKGTPPKPGQTATTGQTTTPGATGTIPPKPGQTVTPGQTTAPGATGIQPPKPGQTVTPGQTTAPGATGIQPPKPGATTMPGTTGIQPPKPGSTTAPGTTGIQPPKPGQTVTPGQTTTPGTTVTPPVRPGQTTTPGTTGIQPPKPGSTTAPGTTGIQPPKPGQTVTPGQTTTPGTTGIQPPKPGSTTAPSSTVTPPVRPGTTGITPPKPGGTTTPGSTISPPTTRPGTTGITPPKPGQTTTPSSTISPPTTRPGTTGITPPKSGQTTTPGSTFSPPTTRPGTTGIAPPKSGQTTTPGSSYSPPTTRPAPSGSTFSPPTTRPGSSGVISPKSTLPSTTTTPGGRTGTGTTAPSSSFGQKPVQQTPQVQRPVQQAPQVQRPVQQPTPQVQRPVQQAPQVQRPVQQAPQVQKPVQQAPKPAQQAVDPKKKPAVPGQPQ